MDTQNTEREPVSHIGKELSFEENKYNLAISSWNNLLLVYDDATQFFLTLNIGDMNKALALEFLTGESTGVRKMYDESIQKSLNDLRIKAKAVVDAFYANVEADMEKMTEKLNAIKNQILHERDAGYSLHTDFSLIRESNEPMLITKNGKTKVSDRFKELLKDRYRIVIANEKQSEVWQTYLDAKAALQRLKDEVHGPYKIPVPFINSTDSMLWINDEGELRFFLHVMKLIK